MRTYVIVSTTTCTPLTDPSQMVAADMVISPAQVDVTLKDVGGLQDVIGKLVGALFSTP